MGQPPRVWASRMPGGAASGGRAPWMPMGPAPGIGLLGCQVGQPSGGWAPWMPVGASPEVLFPKNHASHR